MKVPCNDPVRRVTATLETCDSASNLARFELSSSVYADVESAAIAARLASTTSSSSATMHGGDGGGRKEVWQPRLIPQDVHVSVVGICTPPLRRSACAEVSF